MGNKSVPKLRAKKRKLKARLSLLRQRTRQEAEYKSRWLAGLLAWGLQGALRKVGPCPADLRSSLWESQAQQVAATSLTSNATPIVAVD